MINAQSAAWSPGCEMKIREVPAGARSACRDVPSDSERSHVNVDNECDIIDLYTAGTEGEEDGKHKMKPFVQLVMLDGP